MPYEVALPLSAHECLLADGALHRHACRIRSRLRPAGHSLMSANTNHKPLISSPWSHMPHGHGLFPRSDPHFRHVLVLKKSPLATKLCAALSVE